MKVTFTTNPDAVEKANFVLSQAVQDLKKHPKTMETLGLTASDLKKIETFRKQMIKGFLATAKEAKQ